MTTRALVVAEAMKWLGTPYHSHARVMGVGVDCVHLLCAVYEAVGLLPAVDPGEYAPDWHMHKSTERYIEAVLGVGAVQTHNPQPGDAMLIKYGRTMSHAGILVEPDQLIHAYMGRGVILTRLGEDPLLIKGKPRAASFWTVKGLM